MATNYARMHEKEYDKLIIENETLQEENKRLKSVESTINKLTTKIDKLIEINGNTTEEIKNSFEEIKKLKSIIEYFVDLSPLKCRKGKIGLFPFLFSLICLHCLSTLSLYSKK